MKKYQIFGSKSKSDDQDFKNITKNNKNKINKEVLFLILSSGCSGKKI
jgi:hypothetical protein